MDNNKNAQAVNNAILEASKSLFDNYIKTAKFDKTYTARVVAKNTISNTYTIQIGNTKYPNIRAIKGASFEINDVVDARANQGNMNLLKITNLN